MNSHNASSKRLAKAALAGLLGFGLMAATPALAGEHDKSACKGASGCKGNTQAEKAACKGVNGCNAAEEKEKHACKGMNSCKGQGADGKNECKGHGSCATDGSASDSSTNE